MSASNLTSSSTIRPRNRRLISIESPSDEASEPQGTSSSSLLQSYSNSPSASRGVSPIPSKHPSRGTTLSEDGRTNRINGNRTVGGTTTRGAPVSTSSFASDLWGSSWSSIQGFASSVLGSEALGDRKDKPNGVWSQSRIRNPAAPSFQRNNPETTKQWGPPSPQKQVGVGTKEERRVLVQAKKREVLLSADEQAYPDNVGRHKRRGSDDRIYSSVPPEQREQDALVYVHHVKLEDTMAGVTIKYCCPPAVFRRVNRFWAHDSIQTKKTVLLPVESCGVKGRPIPPSEDLNVLQDDFGNSTPTNSQVPVSDFEATRQQMDELSFTSSVTNGFQDEPLWKHESWVHIGGFPSPVEIGRISSQALGFFPTARRKSNTFSDRDVPSASLDLPRIASSRGSPTQRPSRNRSSSGSHFAQHLQGPGGVGTLGKDVRSPGPPQDKLNKLFAPHLPNVAPRLQSPRPPRSSFDSVTSTGSTGIENVGGAIEGWVRKMASKAVTIVEPHGGGGTMGDLIELNDAFEVGEGSLARDNDDENTPRQAKGQGSAKIDPEALLRERFPVRGRIRGDGSRKDK